jgi:hypothetical protein
MPKELRTGLREPCGRDGSDISSLAGDPGKIRRVTGRVPAITLDALLRELADA